jgi:hypothetical protein
LNNHVSIENGHLVVEPVGMDKLWGLRRRIDVPLDQVRGATYDPGATYTGKGLRAPGLALPGVKWTGTFYRDGDKSYWNVRAGGQTIVIELAGAKFARLYLTVGDAHTTVDRINAAVSG